jgi:ubiquinone/menaquinone biosynthesis C-methylase UbiE
MIVTDFSAEMVLVARRVGGELGLPNVEYLVLDAEDMPLGNASVDGVMCRWRYRRDGGYALHAVSLCVL